MRCPACGNAELEHQGQHIELCPACCWVWCDGDYGLPFYVPECDNEKCGAYVREHLKGET